MKKYSTEYWLQHYEFAMEITEKSEIDTSNAKWTKTNLTRVFNNEFPYGMTGTNITEALIEYVRKHHPTREQQVARLMIEYLNAAKTDQAPLNKVRRYVNSIIKG